MESPNKKQLFTKDQRGLFNLVFLNSAGLEMEEITNIFTQFGKVYSIRESGDRTGYRFVRYKCYEETKRAIEGLKNHPTIKLVIPRKNNQNSNTRNQNANQGNQEHSYNNNNTKNVCGDTNKANNASFWNNDNDNGQINNNSEKNEMDAYQAQSRENSKGNLLKSNDKNSLKSEPSFLNSQTSEEEIPDLIVSNGKEICVSNIYNKKVIIDAADVIVGNIHPNYGAPYILHLLDQFEPIAISNINVVPKYSIRYCYVYFKSIQECQKVERLFDQVDLSGQKLIVQQPCSLITNAVV